MKKNFSITPKPCKNQVKFNPVIDTEYVDRPPQEERKNSTNNTFRPHYKHCRKRLQSFTPGEVEKKLGSLGASIQGGLNSSKNSKFTPE
jgi:hypothetical protein